MQCAIMWRHLKLPVKTLDGKLASSCLQGYYLHRLTEIGIVLITHFEFVDRYIWMASVDYHKAVLHKLPRDCLCN
jgi:hypothetical protein